MAALMLYKTLPPTPVDEPETDADSVEAIEQESMLPSLFPPSNSFQSAHDASPALALAQASLSLPHVLPSSASPSSSVPVPPGTPPPAQQRLPRLRKVKSSHKLKTVLPQETAQPERRRRTRGLSLGTSGFLGFGSPESKSKGKEPVPQSEPKAISRKPSFWSRKRAISTDAPSLPLARSTAISDNDPFVPLSLVLPNTSLLFDPPPSSSEPALLPNHSRGLSRSHSARASSHTTTYYDSEPESQPRRIFRRPATADSELSTILRLDTDHPFTSSPLQSPSSPSPQSHFVQDTVPDSKPSPQQNPPLLQRLSLSLLHSSTSLPSANIRNSSPVPSSSSNSSRPSLNKISVEIPKPRVEEETPEAYLSRLVAVVGRADIASVLASSADPFYGRALRAYLSQFDFEHIGLDIALRRLLMDVGLPRETQQIDRVMEAFALRYTECNPGIFLAKDHAYILAFSLIMLHTDAFNKSNKRKMTKSDYVKNTTFPGSYPEILDCFYDNIVFAPFIYVEDPFDRNIVSDNRPLSSAQSPVNGSSSTLLGKANNKMDPYYLISNNLLDPLRVNVQQHVTSNDPYNSDGISGPWSELSLRRSFAQARVIELMTEDQIRPSSAFFSLNVATGPPSPLFGGVGAFPDFSKPAGIKVKVAKYGRLNRKEDVLHGGRKASNRKWRTWGAMLTSSQLLFFRDPTSIQQGLSETVPLTVFKPDDIFSLQDCIAVYDNSYMKHHHTFRLVMPDCRQFLLQASSDQEMDDWISRINYASAFKSAGVSMRPMGMTGEDVHLTGVAAATSHLHDLQYRKHPTSRIRQWDNNSSRDLLAMLSPGSDSMDGLSPGKRVRGILDDDDLASPDVDGADQFKATFDQVKYDLAAGKRASSSDGESWMGTSGSDSPPPSPVVSRNGKLIPSRSQSIQAIIEELDTKISTFKTQLESEMRLVRSIAILTPFQRSTRDRLLGTLQSVGKLVDHNRLQLAKLACHRNILANDLASASRDWRFNKNLALKAATEVLDSQRLTDGSPTSSHKRDSTSDSFHSALELNWPSSDDISNNSKLSTVITSAPSPEWRHSHDESPRNSEERQTHEKFYTAQESLDEQAEQWNKTRCAHRVSLVRMPSDFAQLSNRFDKRTEGL